MICKKDIADGIGFWTAATSDRVILPNGAEPEQTGWYLDREIERVKEH